MGTMGINFFTTFWFDVPRKVAKTAKIMVEHQDEEQEAVVGLLGLYDGSSDFGGEKRRRK